MTKHAYLIVAHDKFDQLRFLLSLLDDDHHDIFVHIDKKASISDQDLTAIQAVTQRSTTYLVPRMAVHWGDYSQIENELYLFAYAAQKGPYDMYHLLSGVDLPLRSNQAIQAFFEDKLDKIFLTHFNQEEFQELKLHKLVEHYHLTTKISARTLSTPARKLLRAYRILENKVQTWLHIDRLHGNRINWGLDVHANWKSFGHDILEIILSEKDFIEKHFRYSFCADELYLSLILTKHNLHNRIYHDCPVTDSPDELQGNLRYINWWDGHPYEWTDSATDIAQLDKGIALGHLFSRKFNLDKYPGLTQYILEKTKN